MNMNFFKKVMTSFSLIWNAILRKKKAKVEKEAEEAEKPEKIYTPVAESSLFSGVQTSISSIKLTENVKCSETVSEVRLSVEYSTNYMVRSDSMVNFFPHSHFLEKSESGKIFHSSSESNDDPIWIGDIGSIIPEINVVAASAVVSLPVEQRCMQEIMCTSTGILKLSDSCGDVRRSTLVDIGLEESSPPENKMSEQMEEKIPVTQSGFILSCVFRHDGGGVDSDIGNLGEDVEIGRDEPAEQRPQSGAQKFQTKSVFDSKGKALGEKIHDEEESYEKSSTKSEDDTMENIDELSYDVNRGENVVQDIENESQREEFHLDLVPVSRPTQGNEVSVGTGTQENMPSMPKGVIHFQVRTDNSGRLEDNSIQNVNSAEQKRMNTEDFDKPALCLEIPPNEPKKYNFSEVIVPQIIPADYKADNSTVPIAISVNAVNPDDSCDGSRIKKPKF